MFKTLNNDIAKQIILHALDGKARFCAYGLYNHFYAGTFCPSTFRRLYCLVRYILGDQPKSISDDDSIDYCVRYFFFSFYPSLL